MVNFVNVISVFSSSANASTESLQGGGLRESCWFVLTWVFELGLILLGHFLWKRRKQTRRPHSGISTQTIIARGSEVIFYYKTK